MKKLLVVLSLVFVAVASHAATIAVTVKDGSLQPGTTVPFHTSAGSVDNMRVINLVSTGTFTVSGGTIAYTNAVSTGTRIDKTTTTFQGAAFNGTAVNNSSTSYTGQNTFSGSTIFSGATQSGTLTDSSTRTLQGAVWNGTSTDNSTTTHTGAHSFSSGTVNWLNVSTLTIGGNINHLNTTFNLKDVAFGGKCNGVTDDTAALNKAMAAALAVGGGEVNIPAGTCIMSTFSIPSNVSLVGQGSEITVLQFSISVGTAVSLGTDSTRVQIKGIKLYNPTANNLATGIFGITVREFGMENYAVEHFYNGLEFYEPVNCVIGMGRWTGVRISSGTGVKLGSQVPDYSATATDINNGYFSTYSTGVYIAQGQSNRIKSIFETIQVPILVSSTREARTTVWETHFEANMTNAVLIKATGSAKVVAINPNAYEGGIITDWGPRISGNVTVITSDQMILGADVPIQLGHTSSTVGGNISLRNEKGIQGLNPAGSALLPMLRIDSSSYTTITTNTFPLRIEQAKTGTTIGANGGASALTANPVGYFYMQIGGVDRIVPYYTAP